MRFLVTRPQPDCRRTAEKLRALGHVADEAPVLKTVEVRSAQFGLDGVSALAFSSRRSVAVLSAQGRIDALRTFCEAGKISFFVISSVTGEGVDELKRYLGEKVRAVRSEEIENSPRGAAIDTTEEE